MSGYDTAEAKELMVKFAIEQGPPDGLFEYCAELLEKAPRNMWPQAIKWMCEEYVESVAKE